MSVEDDDEQDDAARTIVAGPSFDELMAAVAEPSNDEHAGTAVDARSYDQRLAEIEASSQPLAYAQPPSGPPYDAPLAAAGLPSLEAEEPAPSAPLPKTMILSPGDWGATGQPPVPVASPAPFASTGPQPHPAASPAPYAPQPMAQPFAPAVASAPARKSGLAIFLITALVTVVLGSCAAGIVALLVLRS